MKRIITIIAVLAVLGLTFAVAFAGMHGAGHGGHAEGCQYCGMSLTKFAHTAMTIFYEDETSVSTCSIHCAAVDMALNIDKTPAKITVGDFNTREQIDAEQAFWVIDNAAAGVMTSRAKWAFATRAAAEAYVNEKCASSGRIVSFEDAMREAYSDMYNDTLMIRKMRKMRQMQGGGASH
jgi:nitrous oxide reductase accessory protein NosL